MSRQVVEVQKEVEALVRAAAGGLIQYATVDACLAVRGPLLRLVKDALEGKEAEAARTRELKDLDVSDLVSRLEEKYGASIDIASEAPKIAARPRVAASPKASAPSSPARAPASPSPIPTRPKKAASAPRPRRRRNDGDDDEDEEGYEDKADERASKRRSLMMQEVKEGVDWDPNTYQKVLSVEKYEDFGAGFTLQLVAKKHGKGQWQKLRFHLGVAELKGVDEATGDAKKTLTDSLAKAVQAFFAEGLPDPLVSVLQGTEWGRALVPAE